MSEKSKSVFIQTVRWVVFVTIFAIGVKSSVNEITLAAKISIAPRVFLLQEGAEFIKGLKK